MSRRAGVTRYRDAMTRRFRFGVQVVSAASKAAWVAEARAAEELGYDVIVLPDHIGDQFAPLPALVSIADATERIRVGTFVLDNDFRNPLFLAQEAATVDLLTEGRFELGLGAGWLGRDYERLGLEFAGPRIRADRLIEAFSIIDPYLRGEDCSFKGDHYSVKNVEAAPRCVQNPRPPILIGAGGRRILSFAARYADIISVFFTSRPDGSGFELAEAKASVFDDKVAWIKKNAMGRATQPELNVLLQYLEVTPNRQAAAEEQAREFQTTSEEILALPFHLIGTMDQIAEDLLQRRDRFGISYLTVPHRYMQQFAPIIGRLRNT